ncbi:hypothetical protein BGZ95_011569 [Linnemannia exigua]|uniref:F-box domain-containing protein n=1 Tax=Linnemannia exigua TaxID=604196 RepID=A0AAD4H457_9FUNG|nr:hypothetical protein BGZ95_011569 [Linnemannia exigua]
MTSSTCSSPPPLSPLPSDYSFGNDEFIINTVNDPAAGRLPPEIIERILQHVAIISLSSCCLVNKLWSLCARPFLWAAISPEDVYDEGFITPFANNYQHVRDLKVFVPCESRVHEKLLKPSPGQSSDSATTPTAAERKPPSRKYDKDDDDEDKPIVAATKTLLDCRRLSTLQLHYSASLINTLPHFRDTPHRPNVAPSLRLMIKSAEKIVENNVDSLRNVRVTGLCFPVGEPILKLFETMPKLESLSFLKWVDFEGEEFFRVLVSTAPTLEELSIEQTDLTISYAAIVLLFGWRRVYDEHRKALLVGKGSQEQLKAEVTSTATAATAEGAGSGSGQAVDNEDEDWIPGTRTTPSFAVMSVKTIAGTRRLDRLTNIKSLSLNRSTLSTQLLLRLGALMPEMTALSLKQIYGLGNDDDMLWDLGTEAEENDDIDAPFDMFGPEADDLEFGAGPTMQPPGASLGEPAASGDDFGDDDGSEEEPEDLPDLIPAIDERDGGTAEENFGGLPDLVSAGGDSNADFPGLVSMEEDTDDDLPDLEPAAAAGISSGPFSMPHALDEDEMDYEDDDEDEDDYMYDPYDDYSDDERVYEVGIWAAGGHIHPVPTMTSIFAQHVAAPLPYSNTQSTTTLSKAFRTLHPLCPKIDTFDFSGSRSEALNEAFLDVICELWGGSGSNSAGGSGSFSSHTQATHTGLKVLNVADVCKVETKFFSSIRQRCSSTLTSLDLSLSPKMMWQLRSSAYRTEVQKGMYYNEILQILTTCHALEHLLVGPYPVNGRTIAGKDANWVATRLRTLQLCVEFDAVPSTDRARTAASEETIQQIQSKICQQLGRLSRLETLTLSGGRPVSAESAGERVMDSVNIFGGYTRGVARPGSTDTRRKYLELKLSSGLEHLAGLEALETLDVVFLGPHGLRQDAELAWVALVREYREDLKQPVNTPASGPRAYFAKKRRETGVRLRPNLELAIDPKVVKLNRRGVLVDERLLDDLFMEEGMETQAVIQDNGLHKMYSAGPQKTMEAKETAKAKAKTEVEASAAASEDQDDESEDDPTDDDGDEDITEVSDENDNVDDDEEGESESDEGVTRFNWYVRYIGGLGHAPWDAGHGGIRNGELMTEVMRPREGGRSPSPLGTWY